MQLIPRTVVQSSTISTVGLEAQSMVAAIAQEGDSKGTTGTPCLRAADSQSSFRRSALARAARPGPALTGAKQTGALCAVAASAARYLDDAAGTVVAQPIPAMSKVAENIVRPLIAHFA